MKVRRAFTLPELLVVLGIIVLLLAILLPSLGRARESARSVQCADNVRNIYSAMASYATQNDGVLPAGPRPTDVWRPGVSGRIAYFLASSGSPKMVDFQHDGAVLKYLGDQRTRRMMVRCPNADDGSSNFSYTLHSNLSINLGDLRVFQVVGPENRILIFEQDKPISGQFGSGGADHDADDTPGVPSNHHFRVGQNGRGNYAFGDGHIESLAPADVTAHEKLYPQLTK